MHKKIIMELLTDALVQLQNENTSLYIFIITLEIEIYKPAELVFHLCSIFCLLLKKGLHIPHMTHILF